MVTLPYIPGVKEPIQSHEKTPNTHSSKTIYKTTTVTSTSKGQWPHDCAKRIEKEKAQQENLKSAITDHCRRENHINQRKNNRNRGTQTLGQGGNRNKEIKNTHHQQGWGGLLDSTARQGWRHPHKESTSTMRQSGGVDDPAESDKTAGDTGRTHRSHQWLFWQRQQCHRNKSR